MESWRLNQRREGYTECRKTKNLVHSLPHDEELPSAAAYGTRRTRPYISPFPLLFDAFSSLAHQGEIPALVSTFWPADTR